MNEHQIIRIIPIVLFSISYLQGIILSFLLFINKVLKKISSKKGSNAAFIFLVIFNSVAIVCDYNFFYHPLVLENNDLHGELSNYVSTKGVGSYQIDSYYNFHVRVVLGIALLALYLLSSKIKDKSSKIKAQTYLLWAFWVYSVFNLYFIAGNYYELKKVRHAAHIISEAAEKYPALYSELAKYFSALPA